MWVLRILIWDKQVWRGTKCPIQAGLVNLILQDFIIKSISPGKQAVIPKNHAALPISFSIMQLVYVKYSPLVISLNLKIKVKSKILTTLPPKEYLFISEILRTAL